MAALLEHDYPLIERGGGVAQFGERRASNRKVTKPWLDSQCGSVSLYPWEKHFMLFLTLGLSSQPVVMTQPDERHANRTASVLKW